MNIQDIFDFILPQTEDPIQIIFLAIILFMMLGSMYFAAINAKQASWEKKWSRGTPDNTSEDLDIEHGSVTDLSHAVATSSEKAAEIMPGMLLVVGLLGTFLGLGLALNKASSILGQADAMSAGAAAAAESMSHLMGLLQGLGTKFKTSTWGIAGFVILKIWNEAMRYEEKRMTWVISKVKTEIEKRKQEDKQAKAYQRNELRLQIEQNAHTIVQGLVQQIDKLMQLQHMQHQATLQSQNDQTQSLQNVQAEVVSSTEKLVQVQMKQNTDLQTVHKHLLRLLSQQHEATLTHWQILQTGMQSLQGEVAENTKKMISAHKPILDALDDLKNKQVQNLQNIQAEIVKSKEKLSQVQMKQNTDLQTVHKNLLQQLSQQHEVTLTHWKNLQTGVQSLPRKVADSAEIMVNAQKRMLDKLDDLERERHLQLVDQFINAQDMLSQLHAEMVQTKNGMQTFTQSTQNIVQQMAGASAEMAVGAKDIGSAAERMAQGADKVGAAGERLVDAVGEFKTQFTSVLDNVRVDLGQSIQTMSAQASSTLEKGSAQLSSATQEISTALGVLSRDVNNTMNEVKDSISKALDIQKNASIAFTNSSDSLNESIIETTSIVGNLAEPIKEGLRSVAQAGQQMRNLGKQLTDSHQTLQSVVDQLHQLPTALAPVALLPEQQHEMLKTLKSLDTLGHMVGSLQQVLQSLQTLTLQVESVTAQQKQMLIALQPLEQLAQLSEWGSQQQQLLHEMQGLRSSLVSTLAALTGKVTDSHLSDTAAAGML